MSEYQVVDANSGRFGSIVFDSPSRHVIISRSSMANVILIRAYVSEIRLNLLLPSLFKLETNEIVRDPSFALDNLNEIRREGTSAALSDARQSRSLTLGPVSVWRAL